MVTLRPLLYLQEVAILLVLRTLRDWLLDTIRDQMLPYNMALSARDYQSARDLERWFVTDTVGRRTSAASSLIEDIRNIVQ